MQLTKGCFLLYSLYCFLIRSYVTVSFYINSIIVLYFFLPQSVLFLLLNKKKSLCLCCKVILTIKQILLLELEQSYEIKRTERKNRKSRGRPPKRARRDKEVTNLNVL